MKNELQEHLPSTVGAGNLLSATPELWKLIVIGCAAGLFSGIFGVGGGAVVVPLLVLWLGFDQRVAAGTSLLAIVFIAGFAASLQAIYGNVRATDGILIGLPAIASVGVGARLARLLPHRVLALIFSALLVAAAVELMLE